MTTLTETAFFSRRFIRWGIIGFIGFIILRILFFMALDAYRRAFPPPLLVPNNALGKLPKINFPQTASPSGQLTYTLRTIEGAIPEASEAAIVYFMPKQRSNLLSLSRAQEFVNRLGFTTTPRQVSDTGYRWIDLRNPLRTIEMDVVNNHFELKYNFGFDLSLFAARRVSSPLQAGGEILAFFQKLGISSPDLDTQNPQITYLKLVGDKLEPTTSQSQADAVRVDIFRRGYFGLPTVTDTTQEANVVFIISGSAETDKRIIYAKFKHWTIDNQTIGIYKLKSATTAYNELIAGQAYYARLPNETSIAITNVRLAYFDSVYPQLFMQPVFVFEGEPGFTAYVTAVAPPWIEQ